MEQNEKEIFFHVGTGKTGTTFLQYRVFPFLQGIDYIQRTRYKKAPKLIWQSRQKKILLSREFDQQLEKETRKFAGSFPKTTPIIVFRRQDSYIASQYRRFVKNGFRGSFNDFFDLENDRGYFRKKDLDYSSQVNLLDNLFEPDALVFLYDDLRSGPKEFVKEFALKIGALVNLKDINFNRKHRSYSEKQLKAVQAMGKYINLEKKRKFGNNFLNLFWKIYQGGLRYSTLYVGGLLGASSFGKKPLIPPEELNKIREYYENDWKTIEERAVRTGMDN